MAHSSGICRTKSETRIPLAVSWSDVVNAKEETANSYVLLEDIADKFGVQVATVKKRADGLGIKLFKTRKPEAKNAYCAAVTAEDFLRIAETFRTSNLIIGAHVLTTDEISKLMEG